MKGDEIAARLVSLAVAVVKLVDATPDTPAAKHIAGQLLRSGTSPGANYEETRGAESRRDFLHKIGVTLKELQETRYWLRVVSGTTLVKNGSATEILLEAEELCRITGASKRTSAHRRRSRRSRDAPSVDAQFPVSGFLFPVSHSLPNWSGP